MISGRTTGITGPKRDPRYYQLFCQGVILCYGLAYLDFGRHLAFSPAVIGTCLAVQFAAISILRRLRPTSCDASAYSGPAPMTPRLDLAARYESEAHGLATLTGWDIDEIREEMGLLSKSATPAKKWWEQLR